VRVFDLRTGECVRVLDAIADHHHPEEEELEDDEEADDEGCIARVAHDGVRIYSVDVMGVVHVWTADTGVCERVFANNESSVTDKTRSLMLSVTHPHLIVVGGTQSIRVLDMQTGQLAYEKIKGKAFTKSKLQQVDF
jgi:WD40 repeat protein